ncbi:MAG: MotA/TolQ/ExbB proton channel family protein [Candidatus Muiribacteriota bacterium]|jgi:biopolymer transport protein ExbB
MDFLFKGGFMMIPLLICSILAVAIFIERLVYLNKIRLDSESLMARIREVMEAGKVELAIHTCRRADTPLSRILLSGIQNFNKSKDTIKGAIEQSSLEELPMLEKYVPALGTIAQIAPLIGFLGTVTGMIKTFNVVAMQGLGNDPTALAGGIGEALITTATGLMIGIPTFVLYNYLINRIDRFIIEIERRSMEITNILHKE